MDIKDIRNVAFLSHSSAGKTSLLDALLFLAGANTRHGKVDDGTSMCDYNKDEIERKITITSKVFHVEYEKRGLNLLDTPGYADFIGGAISSVRAADCGVCVVCAVNGVEVGTSRSWEMLKEEGRARILFINKLDKEHSSFDKTMQSLIKEFGKNCACVTYPVGKEASFSKVVNLLDKEAIEALEGEDKQKAQKYREQLIEAAAEVDDKLIEKYLGGEELTQEEITAGLKKAIAEGKAYPVFCGSTTKEIGVKEFVSGICQFGPSPLDAAPIKAKLLSTGEDIEIKASLDEPFCAQVFKTVIDPFVGQLTIFRVFQGTLSSNTGFHNSSKDTKERIGQLYFLKGKEQKEIARAQAGDIVAVAKLKETDAGDTICDEKRQIKFEPIKMPEPAISCSLKPKTRQDEEKIMTALSKLGSEDPTFKYARDQQTIELIASGLGDLHLKVMMERLKEDFKVDVDIGTPKVAYRETIRKKVQVQYKHKKQTGGRGQYGEVYLKMEPLPRGGNLEFVDKVVGGAIPKGFIPAVEKGVKETMKQGLLMGAPIVDIRVTLYDGSYHTVDSSEMSFKIASSTAFRNGLKEGSSCLLEPIMDVEVVIPDEFMGAVTGDLNSRRGRIMGMEQKGSNQVVKAQVPLAEMLKYATELRSMTGGQGSYTMKFSSYEQVPDKIAQQVITQAKAAKGEKEE